MTTFDDVAAKPVTARIPHSRAPIDLCCLVWARQDSASAMAEYEDQVLAFLPDHGGEILARAIGPGLDGTPHETQFIRLPDQDALDAYLADPRRREFSDERERLIERTVIYPVRLTAER